MTQPMPPEQLASIRRRDAEVADYLADGLLSNRPELKDRSDLLAEVDRLSAQHAADARDVVKPAVEREVNELDDAELAAVGYSKSEDECDCYATKDPETDTITRVPPICPHEPTYFDDRENEVDGNSTVLVPVGDDPIPHYNRGRTHIAPLSAKDSR